MKRIATIINTKETPELEKAVAQELNQTKPKTKAIASLLKEDTEDEDTKGIHARTDS